MQTILSFVFRMFLRYQANDALNFDLRTFLLVHLSRAAYKIYRRMMMRFAKKIIFYARTSESPFV
jgi:hypothetical protein